MLKNRKKVDAVCFFKEFKSSGEDEAGANGDCIA